MAAFTTHTGHALCLRREAIDTDQIVPARFCKRITKTGFADALFADWRTQEDFVLNDPRHAGACFLIAGADFGIGSSREHAVWALRDYGFKAVLSTGFGEIFRGNAVRNGLLPIALRAEAIADLSDRADSDPGLVITVDLVTRHVRCGSGSWGFEFDPRARHMLLHGLDEIDVTLERLARLDAYEAARPAWMPAIRPRAAARPVAP
jgi:3-isopropylmalate/(R)-2-methylmalate dehydratase small subunit